MRGVWTPPLKLVDGMWFGLDAQWIDKAGWRGFFCGRAPLPETGRYALMVFLVPRLPDPRVLPVRERK